MRLTYPALLLLCSLVSCVPKTRTNQLVPNVRSTTQTGQAVMVNITNSSNQSDLEGLEITTRDFKQALEKSLVDSGLFRQIGGDGYQLEATIMSNRQPASVFTVTTEIKIAYTLRRNDSIAWKETIRSVHRTESGEALLGEFRDRMSAEGAMRENISLAISSMSQELR